MVVTRKMPNFAPAKQETDAPVAQLVEHLTLNQGVQSSSLCGCTKQNLSGRSNPTTKCLKTSVLRLKRADFKSIRDSYEMLNPGSSFGKYWN